VGAESGCGGGRADPVQVADPSMPGGQAAHGMGAVSGERMERAIKHTYVCGTDEWFAEEV
jgi:hypothetical protein